MKPEKTMKWLQEMYSNLISVKIDFRVPSLHVTAIVKKGKVVVIRSNRVGCSGHTQKRGSRYKLGPATLHSEVAAVRDLKSMKLLKDADIFVWKWKVDKLMTISCNSTIKNSRPCAECEAVLQSCARKYGIRKIYYSSD
jgi:hypothetical protein